MNIEGDAWRNTLLAINSPIKRISRNDALVIENNWLDHQQWSKWYTQFLAPLPKEAGHIKYSSNRSAYKQQYGIQLIKPNIPKTPGVYEIRVVTLEFDIDQQEHNIIKETVKKPFVVYVGKADNLDTNWNSYRGDPNAKGSRSARRLISKALEGVFQSKILDNNRVKSFAIQVRWRTVPDGFHGFFENMLLTAYEYPWNISDNK